MFRWCLRLPNGFSGFGVRRKVQKSDGNASYVSKTIRVSMVSQQDIA